MLASKPLAHDLAKVGNQRRHVRRLVTAVETPLGPAPAVKEEA